MKGRKEEGRKRERGEKKKGGGKGREGRENHNPLVSVNYIDYVLFVLMSH